MAEDPDRPSKIARHILRYGLTTLSALRALVLPDLTEKAASRLAERLVASQWLVRRGLPGGGKYFVLGERAAREHDTTPGLPFGYQAMVARIGVLHFCAKLRTDVFSPAEFRETFPELTGPGFSTSNYYVDPGDVPRLGYIHVDHGQAAERLVTKMRTRIAKRYRHLEFAELIQRGRFLIAIATPTEEKAKAVKEELEGRDPIKVEFRVEAVPELFPLLVDLPPRTRRKGDA